MICRRIYQKKLWKYPDQWWSCRRLLSFSPAPASGTSPTTFLQLGSTCHAHAAPPRFPSSTMSYLLNQKLNHLSCQFGVTSYCFSTQALADSPVNGMVDIPLAQTGEGIAECELLKWFVQEGDQVEEFQPLCEVQSDKATIEITSRYKGKVSEILHVPGNIVKVGDTLLKLFVDEISEPTETSDSSDGVEEPDSNVLYADFPNPIQKGGGNKVLSTPAVRNLAKQYGIDIGDVLGTGKDGRVLREDVINYAAKKGIIRVSPTVSSDNSEERSPIGENKEVFEDKKITLRGYQRAMVKSMTLAAKIPHFHYVEEINCDALVKLKSSFQNENADPDIKFTFLPILIKALSMAMSKYPWLNSRFNEELNEVILKGSHNIGIAMATPHGLVVPNIKNVQSLSILEITKELSRLQQLALANKLNPDDISGGTITLSNIGAIGGKFGSPLVNVSEVCIIALGRIQKVPHFNDDGTVKPSSVLTVNIGADHRVLDGATVAKFCNEWKLYIEKPELLMLHLI
ncbi:OLC1v1020483C1 [Oldenlandia corymbosa var. corymbosa]|uniref:Dihydrolipoamide acetyltransferase component of pyruvate dehydrogenase complex n=1 Tax=Oldenlandia corymbosa var. corymbosa TaxID=529605 RepID=A0AAV1EGN1_OLDCO|nr:OLC1v1020483C1 [Oldenlandia corymbosa var. corymbosa]